ncbi:MAG TPA: sialate O-acetylesterase [Steroidobacteraceae bacterium]|jgi:sialate O-acetylesterase|nr:sialate O-acetylesterase [Steroidobacteraceae bacterium]
MMQPMGSRKLALACVVLAAFNFDAAQAAGEAPLMSAIFADHMVLQRDRPIEVWGRAAAGEQVTVTLGNATRASQADASGRWSVSLPMFRAGGPYRLSARTASRQHQVEDVRVGDVWLCSGQSNMEWAVRNTINAGSEVQHSANDSIRHVTIPRLTAATARDEFPVKLEWKVAGPTTTQDFSAVCYYFARELQKHVQVPQGLINSSWGGTRIETWLSAQALRQLGGNDANLDLLAMYGANPQAAAARWGEAWQKWWTSQAATKGVQPWSEKNPGEWQPAPSELSAWENWNVPALAEYDGMMWYRAKVKLTRAQARQGAKVSLGVIDDVDLVWINGQPVASGVGEDARVYDVPAKLLRAGDNTIVVNVFDMWGSGGIHGPAAQRRLQFADGSSVPLGAFEYQVPPPGLSSMPRAPWEPYAGMNLLYNAMIAPLGKFGLRGVAWYQGEANAGLDDALRYQEQLQMLFTDWRRQFDFALPFFVVQLANWNQLATAPVDSGWARLRDAQRRAVQEDGNAGLAVTIDIGNRDDIHPTNKQDVGRRLARAARHVAFGEKLSASGAAPKSARRSTTGVEVTLGDFDGSLRVIGSKDPAGFELCGDTQATCHYVRARLGEGGIVNLEDPAPEKATRVRFCWADAPLCNLFDTEGLPVGPFELPIP